MSFYDSKVFGSKPCEMLEIKNYNNDSNEIELGRCGKPVLWITPNCVGKKYFWCDECYLGLKKDNIVE